MPIRSRICSDAVDWQFRSVSTPSILRLVLELNPLDFKIDVDRCNQGRRTRFLGCECSVCSYVEGSIMWLSENSGHQLLISEISRRLTCLHSRNWKSFAHPKHRVFHDLQLPLGDLKNGIWY